MVIPITNQSLVKNHDFNHSPITISNGDSNHSPITNQITLHNFLGSNFDYYISNKYSFSIITVVQSACQSILTYFSEKYCLQCWKDVLLRLRMVKECCTLHKVPLVEDFCQSLDKIGFVMIWWLKAIEVHSTTDITTILLTIGLLKQSRVFWARFFLIPVHVFSKWNL